MSDQLDFIIRNLPNLIFGFPGQRPGGLLLTLVLAVVGLGLGFLLALPIGTARVARSATLRRAAQVYIWVFRSVPLILLLLIVHNLFSAGRLWLETSSFVSALISLVLYSSAYQAGVVASGLRAVPEALIDDARTLGAGRAKAWQTVRFPFAVRIMGPAFTNQAITLFKDTSVVVVLGVADLTTTARIALGSDIENAPFWVATYLTVGALYFLVATAIAQVGNRRFGSKTVARTGFVDRLDSTATR